MYILIKLVSQEGFDALLGAGYIIMVHIRYISQSLSDSGLNFLTILNIVNDANCHDLYYLKFVHD